MGRHSAPDGEALKRSLQLCNTTFDIPTVVPPAASTFGTVLPATANTIVAAIVSHGHMHKML